ncbi:MAG: hypothetical protein QM760_04575 [Nibricoccus sp.]
MKAIILCLLLLPVAAFAQSPATPFDDALKQMEKIKAGMTPEQRKQFEATGTEKKMQEARQQFLETQKKQAQASSSAAIQKLTTGPNKIPDAPVLSTPPQVPANKEKLIAYLKPIFAETGKAMDPADVSAVAPFLNLGPQTGQMAMLFWANNELGKALYLLENACLSAPEDTLALNNLGALLTLSGYAEKSLPLLLYAQKIGPENSTLLNNIGQAWLSLGYVDKASQSLMAAVAKNPDNSESHYSLAALAAKQNDAKACAAHMQSAIAAGGVTQESINLLQQAAPDVNIADLIRPRFRQFYKDHSITKRFTPPSVPASYAEAVSRYQEIETYFRNLESTRDAARKTAKGLDAGFQQTMLQAVTTGGAAFAQKAKNPLRLHASVMMANLDNPKFSSSYVKRLQREADNRKTAELEVKKSLAKFDKQLAALRKESGKIEGGEGDIAGEKRLAEIEDLTCQLTNERQTQWLTEIAKVNTQYLHNVEDLLTQRLQEQTFWTTIVFAPADSSGLNYQYYLAYLQDLYACAHSLYPYYQDGGLPAPCKQKSPEHKSITGSPQSWEMEHCDLNFGADLLVAGGKMTCDGWKVYADLKFGEFEYTRSVDPVTWETTGHSISAKAGREKEFKITDNLGGKVEADLKTTIKFDGNMNPVDLVVEASAGAEVSGPLGGSASVDLGSAEISVNGGFNSSGPSIPGFGSDFLRN